MVDPISLAAIWTGTKIIEGAKAVFEAVGNGVKDAISHHTKSALVPSVTPTVIESTDNRDLLEIQNRYLAEKADRERQWLQLEQKAKAFDAAMAIETVRLKQREVELKEIELEQRHQQHQEMVQLHEAALALKRSELAQQRQQHREQLGVMLQIHKEQVDLKLQEFEVIWDSENWLSKLSKTETQNLLLYGQQAYRVLVLVAPPLIADDPDIPQKLRGNLPLELLDIKEFFAQHYALDGDAPVECHGDYFKEPISDLRVRQLFPVLEPIPTIVLYSKVTEEKLTLQVAHWRISGESSEVDFSMRFTLNWEEWLELAQTEELTEKQAIRLLRKTIVDLHRLVAAYLVDLHYLAIDALASYQPHLLELEEEFKLVPVQWKDCTEILLQVREQVYINWQTEKRIQEERQHNFSKICCLHSFQVHFAEGEVVLSPDSLTFATSNLGSITLWDVSTGQRLFTLKGHSHPCIYTLKYISDGRTLVSTSADKTIKIWDVVTQNCLHTFQHNSMIADSLSYSPDSSTLAAWSDGNTIKIWDVVTGNCLHNLEGHSKEANSVVYSPDSRTLASAGRDNNIKIWDLRTGKCLNTLHISECDSYPNHPNVLGYSADGSMLVSFRPGPITEIWDVETGNCINTLDPFNLIACSPNGLTIAGLVYDHKMNEKIIKICDLKTGKSLQTFTIVDHEYEFDHRLATYSHDCRTFACPIKLKLPDLAPLESIMIWDVATGKHLHTLNASGITNDNNNYFNTIAYSLDNFTIVSLQQEKYRLERTLDTFTTTLKIWGLPS